MLLKVYCPEPNLSPVFSDNSRLFCNYSIISECNKQELERDRNVGEEGNQESHSQNLEFSIENRQTNSNLSDFIRFTG